jgi:hypothetical protein
MVICSGVVTCLGQGLESFDDALKVAEHNPVVVGETAVPVCFGEPPGLVGLAAMGGQELGGGLEVGTGQTDIWGRAVLLRRATAEAVRETEPRLLDTLQSES